MKATAAEGAGSVVTACATGARRPTTARMSERVMILFFGYIAVLAAARGIAPLHRWAAWLAPLTIWILAEAESRYSRPWSRVLRDWLALGFILIAYWEIDWFAGTPALAGWQQVWAGWDRTLLDRFRLREMIESLGGFIPNGLEAVYLSLYGIPALCMGILYWNRKRDRIDRLLTTVFLGTFWAYALLPLFPTISPRIAFPGQDLPHYSGWFRWVNLWLLDHCDIATSVFPSGHVAVAFSSAFGLLRAFPERRRAWLGIFGIASGVMIATIYCRYHYAVDGAVSLVISVAAWRLSGILERAPEIAPAPRIPRATPLETPSGAEALIP
jgi:membrane-associated phospholipid phosphatase